MSVHFIPWQASERLSMARYVSDTATEIQPQWDLKRSPNQQLLAGSGHVIY